MLHSHGRRQHRYVPPSSGLARNFLTTSAVGAPLAGWLSDRTVIKYRALRGGIWVPEDRLRSAQLGGISLVPLSILASGITTTFVPGRLGLVLNLICFFVNGVGVRVISFAYIGSVRG